MDKYLLAQAFSPSKVGEWRLLQGYVVSDDGGTVTVTIGGSDKEITGVKYLNSAPSASAGCWIMASDTDLFVLGQIG